MTMRCQSRCWAVLFLVLAVMTAAIPLAAAQPPGDPAAAAAQPLAADPDAPPEPEDDESIVREQTIYVPYNKLKQVFEKQGRGVFLPYEQFQELWKRARAADAPPVDDRPPIGALIAEIESNAEIGTEVVTVSAKLKIELLSEGWHEVPLRLADAAILSAKIGDQPARVIHRPGIGYVLLLKKTGKQPEQIELAIEYSKAFVKTPGRNSLVVEAPQAPVNRWRVRVPQAGVKVDVEPMIAATEIPAQPKPAVGAPPVEETIVMAFVGAAPTVKLDWTPKAEGATGLEALATVQAEHQVTLDEGVIRTRVDLLYKISRAQLSTLKIETPADYKVLNVFDANVKEWTVETMGAISTLTVQLYEPARETQKISIELEKFSDDLVKENVTAPVVKALGVSRQQGVLVVRVGPTLRADTADRKDLSQLDAGELPATLAGTEWTFSFRYAVLPYTLVLDVEKVQPRIVTQELVEAYLEPERLTIDLFAIFTIERAGVFQLELDVPAGFDVRQVRGHAAAGAEAVAVESHHLQAAAAPAKPVDPAAKPADPAAKPGDAPAAAGAAANAAPASARLIVNLSRKAFGKVGLLVELHQRLDDPNLLSPTGKTSEIVLPVPRVAPGGIEHSTGRMIVYAPESLRINPVRQAGAQPISFGDALKDSESARGGRFGGTREVLAFAYTPEPVDLALSAERRKPHITVRQLLTARIESGVVKYEATFYYDILYSGVKSLRLDVPTATAADIRNDSSDIRDAVMTPQPDDVAPGYVAWSLSGETELIGSVEVNLAWDFKMPELEVGSTADLTLPVLKPLAVDRAWGQVVLAKAETLDVQTTPDGATGLRPIDPQRDLMFGASVPDAARAFEFHGDWTLKVTIARYKLEEIKHTSIERAVVRMEVTRSKVISVQALYRMQSARQRLSVTLPAEAKFDTEPLRINGRAVSLEQGGTDQYFIPLVGQKADEPFLIDLRFTMPGDYRRLDLPTFPEEPAEQKVYLCAYLPQELALLGSNGPWTDEMEWRWYELHSAAGPKQTDGQLVAWVIEGLPNVPNPTADFATDGKLYTFSTLRPAAPPDGSLRLVAAKNNGVHFGVFALVAAIGLIFVRCPLRLKLFAVSGVIAALVILGVFLPIFSRQVVDGAFFSAVGLVALIWLAWHIYKLIPPLAAWLAQIRPPRLATAPAPAAAADAGESTAAATPVESPFAAEPVAETPRPEGDNNHA